MVKDISSNKKHVFIAVPVPNAIKQQLHAGCLQIQRHMSFKKWVFPADYHITVKFLGGVDEDTVARIKPLIKQITAEQSAFSLALEGLNTFGRSNSPRILWTSVKGDLSPLFILQKNIDIATQALGFVSENRPYTPHLTIAKNYIGHTAFDTSNINQTAKHLPTALEWEVHEIVLYQTHLGREPMYEPLEVFSLSANSSG